MRQAEREGGKQCDISNRRSCIRGSDRGGLRWKKRLLYCIYPVLIDSFYKSTCCPSVLILVAMYTRSVFGMGINT